MVYDDGAVGRRSRVNFPLETQPQMKRILRTTCNKGTEDSKMLNTIVGYVGGSGKGEFEEQADWVDRAPTVDQIRDRIHLHVARIFAHLERPSDRRVFDEVERSLIPLVLALGRLFLAYFLARRHADSEDLLESSESRGFQPRKSLARKYVHCFFGRVCFWRTYVRKRGYGGFHPLDVALRIPADGFSLFVSDMCARLSTLHTYEQVTAIFLYFLGWSPSKTTVEKTVIGFGAHSEAWFAAAPPPSGDGEVLVVQVDAKAFPTATDEELQRRRGKRCAPADRPLSPRHRGRAKRRRHGPKKRRAPDDKSKNGKAATVVVMYTLKRGKDRDGKPVLLGPINKWVYATSAPKRHAFAVARREADKRGFPKGSRKCIQVVTDGDEDLARCVKDFFPDARHTIDIAHVLEYLWEAARLSFKEDSPELKSWVKRQEALLYRGKHVIVAQHVCELRDESLRSATRLGEIANYLLKRVSQMDYHELKKQDLEVASGAVEGAVRHVVAKRFDYGSMRWIKERAENLLQLRAIEINGQWADFVRFVAARLHAKTKAEGRSARLLTTKISQLNAKVIAA
jgi:hypothetical protein